MPLLPTEGAAAVDTQTDGRRGSLIASPPARSHAGRAPFRSVDSISDVGSVTPATQVVAATRPLRLNRRGRLVRTLAGVAVAAVIVLMVLARWSGGDPAQMDHATTVLPGQTLSDVAHAQLPHLSVAQAVTAVREANQLNSTEVVAGQSLLIPAA